MDPPFSFQKNITIKRSELFLKYLKNHDLIFQSAGGGQARHKNGGQGFDPALFSQ